MDCETVYIGKTGQCLQKRLSEHKGAVKRCDQKNGVSVLAWKNDHRVNWKGARILETEPRYWRRRIQEALWITQSVIWIVYWSWIHYGHQSLVNMSCYVVHPNLLVFLLVSPSCSFCVHNIWSQSCLYYYILYLVVSHVMLYILTCLSSFLSPLLCSFCVHIIWFQSCHH